MKRYDYVLLCATGSRCMNHHGAELKSHFILLIIATNTRVFCIVKFGSLIL